jgi:hypothetical protein
MEEGPDGAAAPFFPNGAQVIKSGPDQQKPNFYVYLTRTREKRILFRATTAEMIRLNQRGATAQRNNTMATGASLTPDGTVVVIEGFHRAISAAHGVVIPLDKNGAGAGWLDYEYVPVSGLTEGDLKLIDAPLPKQ